MNFPITLPTHAAPDMSARYVNIDSNEVIAQMRDSGFSVASIKRNNGRTAGAFYSKHIIDFRLDADMKKRQDVAPRILFMNSHDGSTRAQLISGLIRFVCSNGLVVGDIMAKFKQTHIGLEAANLLTHVQTMSKQSAVIFDQIERLRSTVMSRQEIMRYTGEASILRFGEEGAKAFDSVLLSAPRRQEDTGSDLWTVFNRVQENFVRGGVPMTAGTRKGISRPISNIERDLKLNTSLWDLTASYAE